MFKPYALFIGLRYAGSKRRSQLVSFISLVSMVGMAVGVALLILVLSVMNGFDREMRTRILGLVPQINVIAYGDTDNAEQDWQHIRKTLLYHPEVKAIAPFAQLNAMLLKGTKVEGALIYGIDPQQEKNVSIITDYVKAEALASLESDSRQILLGAALASRLGVAIDGVVNMMVPQENTSGAISPRFIQLTIADIFDTGTELDQSVALIAIETALSLMPPEQRRQGMRITVKDTFQAPRVAWELEQNIPYGYIARDWTRSHGNLYSAIQLSKQLVGLMLLTIIAVAAFNIVSALVMVVTDKRGDIAILRTAGASPAGIMAIFMVQGTVIALIGTAAGTALGVALSLTITDIVAILEQLFQIQFLNSDVYPIDYLPVDLRLHDVLIIGGTACVISVLATIYPAWRASRVLPAEALRHQ